MTALLHMYIEYRIKMHQTISYICFHCQILMPHCILLDSYKTDNPFTLIPQEKEMIKEAWKTAEYFDSQERVRNEARRIARMLQTSKYAIAFTGECKIYIREGFI